MAKDLFSSLQKIAAEANGQVSVNNTGNTELIDKQDIAKIRDTADLAKKMYPTNLDNRFNYWKRNVSLDGMSSEARNEYWKQYEQMHPRGTDGAQSDFVNVTMNELGYINGVSNKEFMLRDRIANSPPWASKVLGPELAKYSTVVANANFSKANQVYSKTLQDKMSKFTMAADLDPDVSVDQHTSDFLRMEQLNLFDVASVVNGRVGAYDKQGQFVPGFAIAERAQIFPDDQFGMPSVAEQLIVRDTATKPIKDSIETKIINQRSDISRQERLSAMGATRMLEQGQYPIERWGEAFSINPESSSQDQIIRGLKGEITAGRIMQEKDLIESIYTAMNKFPTMFGDLNDTISD
jgi:hypothetical protein